jgi:hypothetical protein
MLAVFFSILLIEHNFRHDAWSIHGILRGQVEAKRG